MPIYNGKTTSFIFIPSHHTSTIARDSRPICEDGCTTLDYVGIGLLIAIGALLITFVVALIYNVTKR